MPFLSIQLNYDQFSRYLSLIASHHPDRFHVDYAQLNLVVVFDFCIDFTSKPYFMLSSMFLNLFSFSMVASIFANHQFWFKIHQNLAEKLYYIELARQKTIQINHLKTFIISVIEIKTCHIKA